MGVAGATSAHTLRLTLVASRRSSAPERNAHGALLALFRLSLNGSRAAAVLVALTTACAVLPRGERERERVSTRVRVDV